MRLIASKQNKKTMKRIFHTLLILMIVFFSHQRMNGQTLFPGIENEYPIDFDKSKYFLSSNETIDKVESFLFRVRKRRNIIDSIKLSQMPIKVESFRLLYDIAKEACDQKYPNRRGLTGFIIHYGLDTNDKIELFFQPWCYNFLSDNTTKKIIAGSIDTVNMSVYYQYINERFTPVSEELLEKSSNRFWESISIRRKRETGNDFRDLQLRTDYRSDSKSAYFTFQEILALHKYAPTVNPFYKGYVYSLEVLRYNNFAVHSRAGRTRGTIFAGKLNTISSMFTTAGVYNAVIQEFQLPDNSKEKGVLFDVTEYGNLSGICPPGCGYFEFFYK